MIIVGAGIVGKSGKTTIATNLAIIEKNDGSRLASKPGVENTKVSATIFRFGSIKIK